VRLLPLLALLAACEARPALREWQPADHQPPPSVAPEGQGAGSTGDEAADVDPNARAAAALWAQRCASCHGETGRGDGSGRPPGAQMPDLTAASYNATRSDSELHAIIKQGRNMMPAFGDQLTDLGIDALVKHVRTLSAPR
jgi:mono/diheme cytochrome c family protein